MPRGCSSPRHDRLAEPARTTPLGTSPSPSVSSIPTKGYMGGPILLRPSQTIRPLQWGIIAPPFSQKRSSAKIRTLRQLWTRTGNGPDFVMWPASGGRHEQLGDGDGANNVLKLLRGRWGRLPNSYAAAAQIIPLGLRAQVQTVSQIELGGRTIPAGTPSASYLQFKSQFGGW